MTADLSTVAVALLIAPAGTEEPEFVDPKEALEQAGATVTVVGVEPGKVQAVNGDLDPGGHHEVDRAASEVSAEEFAALVIPGGTVGADKLRAEDEVVALIRDFAEQGKVIAAICHAPWTLIEAGVVSGRTLTSYPSLQTDLTNAGASWVDQEVVVDDGLITSRDPGDLPAFTDALTTALGGS